jgi:hypothetical protein
VIFPPSLVAEIVGAHRLVGRTFEHASPVDDMGARPADLPTFAVRAARLAVRAKPADALAVAHVLPGTAFPARKANFVVRANLADALAVAHVLPGAAFPVGEANFAVRANLAHALAVAHVLPGAAFSVEKANFAVRASLHAFALANVAFGAALTIGQSDFPVTATFPRRPCRLAGRTKALAAAAEVGLCALGAPRQPGA